MIDATRLTLPQPILLSKRKAIPQLPDPFGRLPPNQADVRLQFFEIISLTPTQSPWKYTEHAEMWTSGKISGSTIAESYKTLGINSEDEK